MHGGGEVFRAQTLWVLVYKRRTVEVIPLLNSKWTMNHKSVYIHLFDLLWLFSTKSSAWDTSIVKEVLRGVLVVIYQSSCYQGDMGGKDIDHTPPSVSLSPDHLRPWLVNSTQRSPLPKFIPLSPLLLKVRGHWLKWWKMTHTAGWHR